MKTAICPFSGDPITYGHIDIIERAANTFEQVIAAIGVNPLKEYFFSIEERLAMAQEALKHLPNVEVAIYEGLLAEFANQKHTNLIVRGIRNSEDFEYEWMLNSINESIDHSLETFWIPCRKEKESISSSRVKALWADGKNIDLLVPRCVSNRLMGKIV